MRITGKKNQTKSKIIAAAIVQLKQEDYQKLSLRKLAKNVGLTTGAFYKHFASRDQLFSEVTQELSRSLADKINNEITQHTYSTKENILIYAKVFLKEFEVEPNLMNFLFFNPVAIRSAKLNRNGENTFALLTLIKSMVHQLIEVENVALNEEEVFIQLWSFIQGYAMLIHSQMTDFNPEILVRTLNQFLKEPKND